MTTPLQQRLVDRFRADHARDEASLHPDQEDPAIAALRRIDGEQAEEIGRLKEEVEGLRRMVIRRGRERDEARAGR